MPRPSSFKKTVPLVTLPTQTKNIFIRKRTKTDNADNSHSTYNFRIHTSQQPLVQIRHACTQTISNLKKAMLSCGRMVRLHVHPPTPYPVSKLPLILSPPVCRRSSLLAGREGEEGVGVEPNHTSTRRPGPL